MKIEFVTRTEELIEESDCRDAIIIKINDTKVFEVSDGESEDATLARDFSDCYKIGDLLEIAYNAGRNGYECEFIYSESDEI